MTMITFTPDETIKLNKVCTQLNITLETATSRHPNLAYNILMARLIDDRNNASFEAKKDDCVSPMQRTSLEAHLAQALANGDPNLAAGINRILDDFDGTYAKANQALTICERNQGKAQSQFFPKRTNSKSSTPTSPAIDISSVVMPEEAV